MTEKRFKVVQGYNDRYCQDTATNKLLNQNQTVEYLNELAEENKTLKTQLSEFDEYICDVCSYQYLEKSKMGKYYVAKCKKGYGNCSKGTVIHCKDFEFKELSE